METFEKYIFRYNRTIKEALIQLDVLAADAILFIVNEKQELIGSVTDGDIRRVLISDAQTSDSIAKAMNTNTKFIFKGESALDKLREFREKNIDKVPVLDPETRHIVNVIDFNIFRSYLPIDAVIMAGGKGQRLMPLTKETPKPLLKVGDTPIIERNINRLAIYGIDDITISVKYLGQQLIDHFGDGKSKGISINYVTENEPLGTIGAVSSIEHFNNDYILVMNSDLLTNIDFEEFFLDFVESGADLSILSIPYNVDLPYAVLETDNNRILGLKEKPRYTYYSNGGIYLMKKEVIERIPKGEFFNATDLVEGLIDDNKYVRQFPLIGYWLDIGSHDDFQKAQIDVEHIKF